MVCALILYKDKYSCNVSDRYTIRYRTISFSLSHFQPWVECWVGPPALLLQMGRFSAYLVLASESTYTNVLCMREVARSCIIT